MYAFFYLRDPGTYQKFGGGPKDGSEWNRGKETLNGNETKLIGKNVERNGKEMVEARRGKHEHTFKVQRVHGRKDRWGKNRCRRETAELAD
jgi:hypothetical protein